MFAARLAMVARASAADIVPPAPALLPEFHFEGGDSADEHFRLGKEMGAAYKDAIRERMETNLEPYREFLKTKEGKMLISGFYDNHNDKAPNLIQELQGIANGSGLDFQTVFAQSISQELNYFARPDLIAKEDHCTDIMMCTKQSCIGGHNEDSAFSDRKLFVGHIRLGSSNFTVLNYAGDLPGGMPAMGFNSAGLGFTLNKLSPATAVADGLGRNYISRMLLDCRTIDEALNVIAQKHIAGHNYQLFDFPGRRILNVEALHNKYSVTNVEEPLVHTNHYLALVAPNQSISTSSAHRIARLAELPAPKTGKDILRMLGDQADRSWPVFHDQISHDGGELSDWTLATCLYDLDQGSISLMHGNPANNDVLMRFTVHAAQSDAVV